jgi:hypothetical protein
MIKWIIQSESKNPAIYRINHFSSYTVLKTIFKRIEQIFIKILWSRNEIFYLFVSEKYFELQSQRTQPKFKRRIHRIPSFFVDSGVRSTQITNKKQKGSEKKVGRGSVILILKGFISRRKKRYPIARNLHFPPVKQSFVCWRYKFII